MVPLVFLINGLTKGNWLEAFLFALAVAVGLTPEMLPMIVTVNLSKGAIAMSRKKVIVKRLNSIQNFGAMDVLCTDKTGTITAGHGSSWRSTWTSRATRASEVLHYGYLNSYFQTGLKNLLDVAVLDHVEPGGAAAGATSITARSTRSRSTFQRRRMSVVVEDRPGPAPPDLQGRGGGDHCRSAPRSSSRARCCRACRSTMPTASSVVDEPERRRLPRDRLAYKDHARRRR